MLKSFFFFKRSTKLSPTFLTNRTILKPLNNLIYKLVFIIYTLLSVFVFPFQRWFINFYTVELQTDRLPFRKLPDVFKVILFYFVDIDSWILFFKRIKNSSNLYVIRERYYPTLHRFWCIFFRNKTIYYYELNIKRAKSNKISNFYYKTRFFHKYTKKLTTRKFKVILFYYINKIAFHHYPYLYGTYFFAYNKYQYLKHGVTTSHHVRTHLLFLFVKIFTSFTNKHKIKKRSFTKFSFSSFKGTIVFFKQINFTKKYKPTFRRIIKMDNIKTKPEDSVTLFEKNFIKLYYNLIKTHFSYKFYLSNILHNNMWKFWHVNLTFFVKVSKRLKITWFTKIINSTYKSKKHTIILYLRSSKHFNKGRYSRNRQLYRTGVYWCIWLNVVIVYALHFYFYRVVYSFGYLWFPVGLLLLSIFGSRLFKYRFYNPKQVVVELKEFNNFLHCLFIKIINIYRFLLKIGVKVFIKALCNYLLLIYYYIFSKAFFVFSLFKKHVFS